MPWIKQRKCLATKFNLDFIDVMPLLQRTLECFTDTVSEETVIGSLMSNRTGTILRSGHFTISLLSSPHVNMSLASVLCVLFCPDALELSSFHLDSLAVALKQISAYAIIPCTPCLEKAIFKSVHVSHDTIYPSTFFPFMFTLSVSCYHWSNSFMLKSIRLDRGVVNKARSNHRHRPYKQRAKIRRTRVNKVLKSRLCSWSIIPWSFYRENVPSNIFL